MVPAASRYFTFSGRSPITRQQVASTATGSSPSTNTPQGLGVPWIGPFPSMPSMPSTIAKSGLAAAFISRMELSIPAQCSTFLGQP